MLTTIVLALSMAAAPQAAPNAALKIVVIEGEADRKSTRLNSSHT